MFRRVQLTLKLGLVLPRSQDPLPGAVKVGGSLLAGNGGVVRGATEALLGLEGRQDELFLLGEGPPALPETGLESDVLLHQVVQTRPVALELTLEPRGTLKAGEPRLLLAVKQISESAVLLLDLGQTFRNGGQLAVTFIGPLRGHFDLVLQPRCPAERQRKVSPYVGEFGVQLRDSALGRAPPLAANQESVRERTNPRIELPDLYLETRQRLFLVVALGAHAHARALGPGEHSVAFAHRPTKFADPSGRLALPGLPLGVLPPTERDLQLLELVRVAPVPPRLRQLPLERPHLLLDLADDVRHPLHVRLCRGELVERGALPDLVLHDSGGLLEHEAAVPTGIREDRVNHLAFDQRVRPRADTRVKEQVLDVPETTRGLVEEVLALSRPEDAAPDDDLRVVDGKVAGGVVDGQRHLGHAESASLLGAVEDDVGHAGSAQLRRALLTQDPPNGISDVGFPAPVGPDDARHPGTKLETQLVREGFEPEDVQLLEVHRPSLTRYSLSAARSIHAPSYPRFLTVSRSSRAADSIGYPPDTTTRNQIPLSFTFVATTSAPTPRSISCRASKTAAPS